MKEKTIETNRQKVLQIGMHDAVVSGELVRNIPTRLVFVKNETERNGLEGILAGTFVVTFGIDYIWQKDGDGNWKTIREPAEEE